MFKKIFLVLVLFFIVLILAIAFIGPRLISSDKIKNRVRETIREKYQYDVEIDSFRLSFFLGVKARIEGVHAKSLAGDKYGLDVKAKAFSVSIKLFPLFQRKIEIGNILLDEPVVTLEEKEHKKAMPVEVNASQPIAARPLPAKKETKAGAIDKREFSISISGLVIRNGKIKVKSSTLLSETINDMEFSDIELFAAPLVLNRPVKIKLKGRLAINPVNGKSPFLRPVAISLVKKIKIEEQAITIEKLKLDIETVSISLEGSFSNFEAPVVQAKLSLAELDLGSLKDFVNFGAGQGMSGSLGFEGTLTGPLEKYSANNLMGILKLKNVEFKGFAPNAVCKMNGRLNLTSSSVLKEVLSGNLNNAEIKGKLSVSEGSFNKIVFQDLSSEIKYKNNIMELAPIDFSLYDGRFNGVVATTLGQEPDFNFKAEVKDIAIDKFLADTSTMKDTVYGKVYSRLEVKGGGSDLSKITETLTGNMHVEMRDGKITTLNLLKDILSVAGLLTGMRPPEGNYTPVDLLTADLVIGEGKASTNNLHLISKRLEVIGKGHFSFDQRLNFIMDAYVGTPREGFQTDADTDKDFFDKFMRDQYGRLVIPIKVTGPVKPKPHVTLDFERLTTRVLEEELKDILPPGLKDLFPKIFK